jgi:hypothetical protein
MWGPHIPDGAFACILMGDKNKRKKLIKKMKNIITKIKHV